jgi:hypothetical protein
MGYESFARLLTRLHTHISLTQNEITSNFPAAFHLHAQIHINYDSLRGAEVETSISAICPWINLYSSPRYHVLRQNKYDN